MTADRLTRQLTFLREIDRLKTVFRQTYLLDGSRKENDAEHAWELAMMAVVLAEYADQPVDLGTVIRMVLVHDLVEIDAGDTYAYDRAGLADKAERERAAAERIFAMLPEDQAAELRGLWEAFEACATPEARFAAALDRFQPLLHNYLTEGKAWQEHRTSVEPVRARNAGVAEASRALGREVERMIAEAVAKGHLGA